MDSERKPPPPGEATAYDYERLPVTMGPVPGEEAPTTVEGQAGTPLPVAGRRKSVLREYVEAIAIAILLAATVFYAFRSLAPHPAEPSVAGG